MWITRRFMFSSPHGDFSFSIRSIEPNSTKEKGFRPLTGISLFLYSPACNTCATLYTVFVPSRGFLFFYKRGNTYSRTYRKVFVPSRGFLFFYCNFHNLMPCVVQFSSPHGDFSFSIAHIERPVRTGEFSSPHGDFSFSIQSRYRQAGAEVSFRPLTGISLFL